jgi:hypothetical protein
VADELTRLLRLLALFVPGALAAQDGWQCYEMTYVGARAASAGQFPSRIALGQGQMSPAVQSRARAGDDSTFWEMFQNDRANWRSPVRDSLAISMSNGFTFVSLEGRFRSGGIEGRGSIRYDFGPRDTVSFAARSARCESADTTVTRFTTERLRELAQNRRLQLHSDSIMMVLSVADQPLAGTYEFMLTLGVGDTLRFFARTTARAIGWEHGGDRTFPQPRSGPLDPPGLIWLPCRLALRLQDLPPSTPDGFHSCVMRVGLDTTASSAGQVEHAVDIFNTLSLRALVTDRALATQLESAGQDAAAALEWSGKGKFVSRAILRGDGSATIHIRVINAHGGVVYDLVGRRISLATLRGR